jgi:hypothetical protein
MLPSSVPQDDLPPQAPVLPYLGEDEIQSLRRILECPPVQQLAIWGSALERVDPRRLAGYWTLFLLSDVDPPHAPHIAENPPTRLHITLEPSGPQLHVMSHDLSFTARMWLWRLYDDRTPGGYADLRWVPPGRFEEVITFPGGPDWIATPRSIDRLWTGLRALVHQVRLGRPLGTGAFASAEECRQAVIKALRELPSGRRRTKTAVSLALFNDPSASTLSRWLRRFALDWNACVAEAQKPRH